MARMHISIPAEMAVELDAFCNKYFCNKSRLIARGLRLALDDARTRFGNEASNDAAPPTAAAPAAPTAPVVVALAAVSPQWPASIERRDGHWFDMDDVLGRLALDEDRLFSAIDEDDDVLTYAGKRWIDKRGALLALCLAPGQAADTLQPWINSRD